MDRVYEIFHQLPHEHIQSDNVKNDERFDIFRLGNYSVDRTVLDIISSYPRSGTEEIVELVRLQANVDYKPHFHLKSSAVIYMIIGQGRLILDNKEIEYCP